MSNHVRTLSKISIGFQWLIWELNPFLLAYETNEMPYLPSTSTRLLYTRSPDCQALFSGNVSGEIRTHDLLIKLTTIAFATN